MPKNVVHCNKFVCIQAWQGFPVVVRVVRRLVSGQEKGPAKIAGPFDPVSPKSLLGLLLGRGSDVGLGSVGKLLGHRVHVAESRVRSGDGVLDRGDGAFGTGGC